MKSLFSRLPGAKSTLIKSWEALRTSFWFLPTLLVLGAIALAQGTLAIDNHASEAWLTGLSWVYTGGAEGASTLLGTIAGSMMTIAGVVFSMTLVALSLASSQLGPRLLRNFMRDPINQIVLGTFIATFLYCLLVLRSIRHGQDAMSVPHLAVTLALILALASVGVLIYFIHHVSVSIQADHLISRVGDELTRAIKSFYPNPRGNGDGDEEDGDGDPEALPPFDREASVAIPARGDGYLEVIDLDSLLDFAEEHDLRLRLERRPGHYVIKGSDLLIVSPRARLTDQVRDELSGAFALGRQRTSSQDLEFSVTQLVEIAVRALSPGINDPFTAIACVDRLGSGLAELARRRMDDQNRRDAAGQLRVSVVPVTFAAIADVAFNLIRQHARSSTAVTIRLLETIAQVAAFTRRPADRAALRRHADMILRGAREGIPEPEDLQQVEGRHAAAMTQLASTAASS